MRRFSWKLEVRAPRRAAAESPSTPSSTPPSAHRAPTARCCRRRRPARPDGIQQCAVSAVVVVLPLLPVIAMIFADASLANPKPNSSDLGRPARHAPARRLDGASCTGTPGRNGDQVDAGKGFVGERSCKRSSPPARRARKASTFGGCCGCRRRARGALPPAIWPSPDRTRRGREPGTLFRSVEVHVSESSTWRPTSTSMMVMIQKRTTTWVSFQPPSSKW